MMNSPRFNFTNHIVIDSVELVRGAEQQFIAQLAPMVSEQNVTLDLRNVARVDAAGLAALITLYCDACKAGRSFHIANPSTHVAELLALVRLDRLLVDESGDDSDEALSCPEHVLRGGLQLQGSAA